MKWNCLSDLPRVETLLSDHARRLGESSNFNLKSCDSSRYPRGPPSRESRWQVHNSHLGNQIVIVNVKLLTLLKQVGIKDGYLFLVNGVLFLVIFLLCRVLSVPFMFLRYSYHADIRFAHVPLNIPYKCTLTCLSFFLLQFYWFILICRGLQRFLFKTVSKAS